MTTSWVGLASKAVQAGSFSIGILCVMFSLAKAAPLERADASRSIVIGNLRVPEEPTLILKDFTNSPDRRVYKIRSPSSNHLDSGVVALIKSHAHPSLNPAMPQLQASLADLPANLIVSWRFQVMYRRPNERLLPEDTVSFPSTGFVDLPSQTPWQVFELYKNIPFFGGDATFTFKISSRDKANTTPEYHYRFRIGGQNPDEAIATKYIDDEAARLAAKTKLPVMWYASAIAKSETKYEGGVKPDKDGKKPAPYYNQFLPRGYKGDPETPPTNPETFKPNWHNDGNKDNKMPKVGGFGIFQVTGNARDDDADVPRDVIWNWQKNVTAGLQTLQAKQKRAISWMNEQNAKNPPPVPPVKVRLENGLEVVFAENTARTITDVVAIKGYNGNSYPKNGWLDPGPEPEPEVFHYTKEAPLKGYYVYYCDERSRWCLSRFNAWKKPFNYVNRVCLEVPPLRKP